ncbi:MAG: hypothetical protein WBI18_02390 [Candidatus Saccharicenans sp.]
MDRSGITRARRLLGDQRLLNFLRFVNEKSSTGKFTKDVLAVKLINEALDRGESLEAIFEKDYVLKVFKYGELHYRIEFGCAINRALHTVGDGATWEVRFNPDGTVASAEMTAYWIS